MWQGRLSSAALVALVGTTLLSAGAAPAIAQAQRHPVRVTVTSHASEVAPPGSVTFVVKARNESQRTLRHLAMGYQLSLLDPENFRADWSPALGACGAAAGTDYCAMPSLPPSGSLTWTVHVHVPGRISASGPRTVGQSVGLEAFVQSHRQGPISNIGRTSVRVVAHLSGVPVTGTPTSWPLLIATWAIGIGAGLTLWARRLRSAA